MHSSLVGWLVGWLEAHTLPPSTSLLESQDPCSIADYLCHIVLYGDLKQTNLYLLLYSNANKRQKDSKISVFGNAFDNVVGVVDGYLLLQIDPI